MRTEHVYRSIALEATQCWSGMDRKRMDDEVAWRTAAGWTLCFCGIVSRWRTDEEFYNGHDPKQIMLLLMAFPGEHPKEAIYGEMSVFEKASNASTGAIFLPHSQRDRRSSNLNMVAATALVEHFVVVTFREITMLLPFNCPSQSLDRNVFGVPLLWTSWIPFTKINTFKGYWSPIFAFDLMD